MGGTDARAINWAVWGLRDKIGCPGT